MGVKGLFKLLADECPDAIKEIQPESLFSRKIAIDTSTFLYQFLIAIRGNGMDLTNESGELTSHLRGLFSRTTKFLEYGIKPVFVFDGTAPKLKAVEIEKRREKVRDAEKQLAVAEEQGDDEKMIMFAKRTVRVTKEQNDEAKKLIRLMGLPVVQASSEAEGMCAALCKAGLVYATATEDADSLTFGTDILIRHITFSEARKVPIQEINMSRVLTTTGLTMDQFIDVCILSGCDFSDGIKGIGQKKAFSMIKEFGSIEKVIEAVKDKKNYIVADPFPFQEIRDLFKQTENLDSVDLKFTEPDEEGLIEFLVKEKQFDETGVRNTISRIKKTKGKASQGRLDSFFKVIGTSISDTMTKKREESQNKVGTKRKRPNKSTQVKKKSKSEK